jgi:ATP-dependent helicase HrpA
MKASELPVWDMRDEIVELVRHEQVVVIEGATGCGKSTQIPRMLYEAGAAGQGRVGVTQPRRIACVSVSHKIATDMGVEVGAEVGYKMRFSDLTSRDTRIKIMTDGTLIQEMQHDPNLEEYDVLMVDEAHERSLNIDIILGLLKPLLQRRRDLRVIISSATIRAETFVDFFGAAPILQIPVHPHAIRDVHVPMDEARIDALIEEAVNQAVRIVRGPDVGDILIFLTGEGDIKRCAQALDEQLMGRAVILPLYARLSREEQERVFDDFDLPKIVISTNIAETSVTIDGIDWVIDSGRVKMNLFDPRSLISKLEERGISQASATQRRGRTGRTGPGTCIRLYSKREFQRRPRFTQEEIKRSDLSEVVLRMLDLGIKEVERFDFITPPGRDALTRTVERLEMLGAIDEGRDLTEVGHRMVQFPLEPVLSRIVIEALDHYPDVVDEVLIACAFLSTRHPFLLPIGDEQSAREAHQIFADPKGDFIAFIKLYEAFQRTRDQERFCERNYLDLRMMAEIVNVIDQLREIVTALGGEVRGGGRLDDVLKALATGLRETICRRIGGRAYETLTEREIIIHPGSLIDGRPPRFMVCGEIVHTSRRFARSCSPIDPRWLAEISPVHEQRWGGSSRKQRRETRLEVGVEAGRLEFKPDKKGKAVRLDLSELQRLVRETPRRDVLALGRLKADVRDRGLLIFRKEPLLDLYDYLRVVENQIERTQAPQLKSLMDAVDDLAALERFAAEGPRLAVIGKGKRRAGFVTLFSGDNRVFWFDLVGNPAEALVTSAESLRLLGSELEEAEGQAPGTITAAIERLDERLQAMVSG